MLFGRIESSECQYQLRYCDNNYELNLVDCFTREQMDECRANGTFLYNQTCTDIVNVCHRYGH